jgi:hypothetical protein
MRRNHDIVIIPDDSEKPVVWRIKIGGEPLPETFPSLELAKIAALDAMRANKVEAAL